MRLVLYPIAYIANHMTRTGTRVDDEPTVRCVIRHNSMTISKDIKRGEHDYGHPLMVGRMCDRVQ